MVCAAIMQAVEEICCAKMASQMDQAQTCCNDLVHEKVKMIKVTDARLKFIDPLLSCFQFFGILAFHHGYHVADGFKRWCFLERRVHLDLDISKLK